MELSVKRKPKHLTRRTFLLGTAAAAALVAKPPAVKAAMSQESNPIL